MIVKFLSVTRHLLNFPVDSLLNRGEDTAVSDDLLEYSEWVRGIKFVLGLLKDLRGGMVGQDIFGVWGGQGDKG